MNRLPNGSRSLDVVLMRGGTSRGPVVHASDLPADPQGRDELLLRLVGAEMVQLDGVGGGSATTSKVVVVGEASGDPDTDLHYQVGNVVQGSDAIDWSGTCGNMTATVPVFALESGLRSVAERISRLRNVSTGQIVETEITSGLGGHRPGDEVKLRTTYLDPGASIFKSTLPTGSSLDVFDLDGTKYEGSVVDITHPYLFLDYDAVVRGGALPDAAISLRIEQLRAAAAVRLGVVDDPEEAASRSPAVPRVVLVHAPGPKPGRDEPIRISAISMGQSIGSVPVTAAMCLAAARKLAGTLVYRPSTTVSEDTAVTISAPRSSVSVVADVTTDGHVISTSIDRTSRSILRGTAFIQLH